MNISSKLVLLLLVVVLFTVGISMISYFYFQSLDHIAHEINEAAQAVINFEEIRTHFLLQNDELDEYIDTQTEKDISEYYEKANDVELSIANAKVSAQKLDDVENLMILESFEAEIKIMDSFGSEIIQLIIEGKKQEAINKELYELQPEIDKADELLSQIISAGKMDLSREVFEADTETDRALNVFIVTASVLMMVVAIILIIILHSISGPLLKLKNATHQIADGNLDIKLDIKSKNEFGELSKAFHNMAFTIKKQQTEKDEFASMISHELKTPLTPIVLYCDILLSALQGKLNSEQRESIEKIDASAKKMQRLIGDMFDIQKLDISKMKFNKSAVKIRPFLDSIIKEYEVYSKINNVKLTLVDPLKITITSDEDRLKQVFSNLINNSIDFSPVDLGTIDIGAYEKGDEIIFYVKDNGSGIPVKEQKHLFTKFYQVDTSFTRKHAGTGLGLSICKGIIEGLGGKIWFESKEDIGTSFYFSLKK